MAGCFVCCRLQADGNAENTKLGQTGGVAIAGALQHVPSLTVLEYVVGEGGSAKRFCGMCLNAYVARG